MDEKLQNELLVLEQQLKQLDLNDLDICGLKTYSDIQKNIQHKRHEIEKQRHTEIQRELAQVKLANGQRLLIGVDYINLQWYERSANIANTLRGWSSELPLRLKDKSTEEMAEVITTAVTKVLDVLAAQPSIVLDDDEEIPEPNANENSTE